MRYDHAEAVKYIKATHAERLQEMEDTLADRLEAEVCCSLSCGPLFPVWRAC